MILTPELRAALVTLAFGLYGVFTILSIRSARHSHRVAEQWDEAASDHWRYGKLALVIGNIGVFFTLQQVEPIPFPWISILFFGFVSLLLYGEWRMGCGFRDVADAQAQWHRRNFFNGED